MAQSIFATLILVVELAPIKIFEKHEESYKISYKDFTSLYPYTNFITTYFVGHPKCCVFQGNEQDVNWTKSSDNIYFGKINFLLKIFLDILKVLVEHNGKH